MNFFYFENEKSNVIKTGEKYCYLPHQVRTTLGRDRDQVGIRSGKDLIRLESHQEGITSGWNHIR